MVGKTSINGVNEILFKSQHFHPLYLSNFFPANNILDLQEFVSLMRKIEESMKAAFAQVDSNQDGRISVCEMKQVRS